MFIELIQIIEPSPAERTFMEYQEWVRRMMINTTMLPNWYFVAPDCTDLVRVPRGELVKWRPLL